MTPIPDFPKEINVSKHLIYQSPPKSLYIWKSRIGEKWNSINCEKFVAVGTKSCILSYSIFLIENLCQVRPEAPLRGWQEISIQDLTNFARSGLSTEEALIFAQRVEDREACTHKCANTRRGGKGGGGRQTETEKESWGQHGVSKSRFQVTFPSLNYFYEVKNLMTTVAMCRSPDETKHTNENAAGFLLKWSLKQCLSGDYRRWRYVGPFIDLMSCLSRCWQGENDSYFTHTSPPPLRPPLWGNRDWVKCIVTTSITRHLKFPN